MSAKKILIVDDQESIRNMLSELLSMAGYSFEMARNGEEALEIAVRSRPDLIIMDLMMPVKNGLEAATEIRTIPELTTTPILFLTARGQKQDEEKVRNAGGNALMAKPFSPRQVLEKIRALLGET
ncbi:MAG: response regulator transcription factor [Spirochaetales bacterium]|nr:response regulator transcription factor [Spirochaetales bacterium]